jgi:prepilin-type N-terminal cleavage/methylation domain-containing protein
MSPRPSKKAGFTILELLMAMALFAIAGVSLAEALNLISLTVTETIEESELREQLRAVMLEVTRDPNLTAETRETEANTEGLAFRIDIERLELNNEEGESLANMFSVKVTALRIQSGGRKETLDSASTIVNPGIF